jgi:tetratricopeptide (TPR) repeat protein
VEVRGGAPGELPRRDAVQFRERVHDARDVRRAIQSELGAAWTTLNNPLASPQVTGEYVSRAKIALDKYGVLRSGDLDAQEFYKNLDPASRSAMKKDTAELLYLLASGTGQLALASEKPDRRKKLYHEAMQFNDLSHGMLQPISSTRAIDSQKVRLLALAAGKIPKLQSLKAEASTASDPSALRLLAYESSEQQDFETASSLLERVVQALPQDSSAWISLGTCRLNMEKFAEAEGCFEAAIALQKDCLVAYELRGLARFGLHKLQLAREDFDHVLAVQPTLISALINRSLVLKELGDIEGAIRDLSAALKCNDCPTRLYFVRSELKRTLGDASGAKEDRLKGLQLEPNEELSWVTRGIAQLSENPEVAMADFREAIQCNSQSFAARQNMAYLLAEVHQEPERAIRVLNESLEIRPHDADTVDAVSAVDGVAWAEGPKDLFR